jgi:hypothetical protein
MKTDSFLPLRWRFRQLFGSRMNKTAGRARLIFLLIAGGAVLAACAQPNPNTPAGQTEMAVQKCSVCILENPGDRAPCREICMQTDEGQVSHQRAYPLGQP